MRGEGEGPRWAGLHIQGGLQARCLLSLRIGQPWAGCPSSVSEALDARASRIQKNKEMEFIQGHSL